MWWEGATSHDPLVVPVVLQDYRRGIFFSSFGDTIVVVGKREGGAFLKTFLGFSLLVLLQLTNLDSSIAQEFSPTTATHRVDPRRHIEQQLTDGMGDEHHVSSAASHLRNEAPILTQRSTDDSVKAAWVRRYASGLIPSADEASALAVDGLGNVYVTGWSDGSETNHDYATIKYNASGDAVWIARYNGSGNAIDEASALAVDSSFLFNGAVYVTGRSYGSGGGFDYTTIKYTPWGDTMWSARYDGPGNSYDAATALAVDASGNVYVTGTSDGLGTSRDYATIKYNASGDTLWTARYNGPGNSDDRAYALAVDGSGNVYVTGWSMGSGTPSYDYATIKYNAVGDVVWVARYNGPANSDDGAYALAVDGLGNVYVTGSSHGSGSSDDYTTIKYNASGIVQWAARYNGPGNSVDVSSAIVVDVSGNVYVTGSSYGSGTGSDYATVKYDSAGDTVWVARYNGPGGSYDAASALAVDGSGNVYVAGLSYGSDIDFATIKYDSAGDTVWVARYNGPGDGSDAASAIAVDGLGNVYVAGLSYGAGTSYDYATIKYDVSGDTMWTVRYNGPGLSEDFASALTVDGSGNVYVTGSSRGSGSSDDYATVKYNAYGDMMWIARYNGPENHDDKASALAIDGSGNVYVTGSSLSSGSGDDYLTVKYNANGDTMWTARYNGPGDSTDVASALAVDASGNVYVTGYSIGSGTGYDYATIKYNAAGAEQWAVRYNGRRNSDDEASALAVDDSGNAYVTGYITGSGFSYDYATIKYNALGDTVWTAQYNGPGNSNERATALAIDHSGNVYVTGSSSGGGTENDYLTIKYNASGNTVWTARYNGPGNSGDFATALAIDASGNVYVTGWSYGAGTSYDYATIKYTASGDSVWTARYNGPGNSEDIASALAIDRFANVYVTGQSYGAGTSYDYLTIKYNALGDNVWMARYNGALNPNDAASALAVDSSGNVYVTGSSSDVAGSVYTTIKYEEITVGVGTVLRDRLPKQFLLAQNYPNPFNPSTSILYDIGQRSFVTLKVYDVLGREVATVVNARKPAGEYTVEWNAANLPSGVYFYRLVAGDFVETRKMILMR